MLPRNPPAPDRARPARLAATAAVATLLAVTCGAVPARAFCGFYVAQADAKLFNHASKVVLARADDRTVVTMSNDYRGTLKEFAIVVPVPTVLEKDQVHVGDEAWVDALDRFSAPRLVEYHDPPPCAVAKDEAGAYQLRELSANAPAAGVRGGRADALGVVIERSYTVGEYDILILSARDSGGLLRWLAANRYRVPASAGRVLRGYIAQGLKFFVARVNLEEQSRLGFRSLRPIQMAYESPRFMLPIRLGMANADGPQEILLYTLTRHGRVEPTNYRLVRLPTDVEVPLFVRAEFGDFYAALFDRQVRREGMRAVFLEHAWSAGWCDPCAGDPPSAAVLRALGAWWLEADAAGGGGRTGEVFVTRLHARYDQASFPEDLVFQETANTENFQCRYVMRHPYQGDCNCAAGARYRAELIARRARQERDLVNLTGWPAERVRRGMAAGEDAYLPAVAVQAPETWWQKLWRR